MNKIAKTKNSVGVEMVGCVPYQNKAPVTASDFISSRYPV